MSDQEARSAASALYEVHADAHAKGNEFVGITTKQAEAILAERERLLEALAEILQYTVEPRWTPEERLSAIRDVVARAER